MVYSIDTVERYKSETSEKEFGNIIKYFETTGEHILFDENEGRKSKFTEMLNRLNTLQKIASASCKTKSSRNFEIKSFKGNGPKRRKISRPELPTEIWMKILNFMSTRDTFNNFVLVCKNFDNLTRNSGTMKYLQINAIEIKEHFDSIKNVIQNSNKSLRELKLKGGKYVKQLVQMGLECPNLKSLIIHERTIGKNFVPTDVSEHFARILLANGTNLEHLDLSGIVFRPFANYQKITQLSNLKSLHTSMGTDMVPFSTLEKIANNCKKLERITFTSLNSSIYRTSTHGIETFNDFFTKLKDSLKSITTKEFTSYHSLDEGEEKCIFLKQLQLCDQLEEIKILNASFVTDYGLGIIARLPNLKTLELVKLVNDQLCDLKSFFSNLSMTKLQSLTILWSNEDDIMCLNLPTLRNLKIENCPNLVLTDKSLKRIVESCSNLMKITLHWKIIANISNRCFHSIISMSRKMYFYVAMGESTITIEDFVRSRPKIKYHNGKLCNTNFL